MRIVRNPRYLIDVAANVTDEHILAAITPPRAWVDNVQPCAEGTIYRVIGYTLPLDAAEYPITGEDLYGPLPPSFMLEVPFLVPAEAPGEAHIMYAFEADERGFWDYGGTQD